jgi:hypothetical protein
LRSEKKRKRLKGRSVEPQAHGEGVVRALAEGQTDASIVPCIKVGSIVVGRREDEAEPGRSKLLPAEAQAERNEKDNEAKRFRFRHGPPGWFKYRRGIPGLPLKPAFCP